MPALGFVMEIDGKSVALTRNMVPQSAIGASEKEGFDGLTLFFGGFWDLQTISDLRSHDS